LRRIVTFRLGANRVNGAIMPYFQTVWNRTEVGIDFWFLTQGLKNQEIHVGCTLARAKSV
jgi:hypothetical protein